MNDTESLDLAIKFNNTSSRVVCFGCGVDLHPEVGYEITLRDTFDFVCDECVRKHSPRLIVARDISNEDYSDAGRVDGTTPMG